MILILNEQSAWLYPLILTDSLKMDYPFQIACVQPPSPLRKNRRRGVCGGGGRLYRPVHGLVSDGQSISSSSVKTANNKMPVSSVFNDSEGLYRTTVSVALSVGLTIPRGTVRFGSCVRASFFFSDTPPKYPDGDCAGRRRTGTRHGNVYRSFREKQLGIVVYRQRVLQTVASLRVVSLVLRGHDPLKISNINPQREARFLLWKKLVHRESGGNGA